MPVIRFICPHCEKPAEVQVTAVARSRPCPQCGETVVLQVSARSAGNGVLKRRALLVNPAASAATTAGATSKPAEPAPPRCEEPVLTDPAPRITPPASPTKTPPPPSLPVMNGPVYEPVGMECDVVVRLKYDPEVIETRRRLTRGVMAVALCIIVAVLWDRVSPWSARETRQDTAAPVSQKPVPAKPSQLAKKENNIIGMLPRGVETAAEGTSLPDAIPFQGAADTDQPASEPQQASPGMEPIRIVVPSR